MRRSVSRRVSASRWSALAFALATLVSASSLYAQPPWAFWEDPLALARFRDDHSVVQWSSFSPAPCRYGTDGAVLPDALDCRYDHLFRPLGRHRELRADQGELVLVDERGAGALVRTWMTTGDGFSADFPKGLRLRVRLDGHSVPYIDADVSDWFAGDVPPFLWPMSADRHRAAGAGFSYVPIVFNRGMTISLAGPDAVIDQGRIWYQFNVHRVAADAGGPSGIPAGTALLQEFMSTPVGQYPWPGLPVWQSGSRALKEGAALDLLDMAHADTILGLRLRVSSPEHWQSVRLGLQFDDGAIATHPLSTWFGLGDQPDLPWRSLLLGRDAEGFAYLYWPMPFHQRARVRLERAIGSGDVSVDYAFALAGQAPPADAMRFGLGVRDECQPSGRQHDDLTLLHLTGRGRWLGQVSLQRNALSDNANYLEGDERIYVDGSAHPAWHGTGNEDFYNAGFYFDQGGYGHALSLPLSGALWHQMLAGSPVASRMYRLLLGDAIPFRSRLLVRLERGAYGDQAMCARTAAFYYHEPLPAMAPAAELDLTEPASVAAADYRVPGTAVCETLTSQYADEPPTHRAGQVCRYAGGESSFQFQLVRPAERLWLRRRFDGGDGGQAARVLVDDVEVASFSYAPRHPDRRWQEVDMPLALPPQLAGSTLAFRIVPMDPAETFTEAGYVLLGTEGDALFADGFEVPL